MTLFKKAIRTVALATLFVPALGYASAVGDPTVLPGSTQVGQPGLGSDMWTQAMTQLGLFRVHRNDCDDTGQSPTEIFVEVYTDDNSVAFGYCIEKDERTAQQFEDARQTCLDNGKRLPEPAEWKFACDIGTGLNNMTDDNEWMSNFAHQYYRGITNYEGIAVPAGGNTSCKYNVVGWVQRSQTPGASASLSFRCVR